MSEDRINGDLPISSPAEAALEIAPSETLLVSGFGSVGYPKSVSRALAADERELALTLISGGSVGGEIDIQLVEAEAIARRFPYQARPQARSAINRGKIAFHDRNISTLGDEVKYGPLMSTEGVALIEALAVGSDWLIPTTSIGHSPAFIETADDLIVEVNSEVPKELSSLHDIHRLGRPPHRDPIPLSGPGDTIGGSRIHFDPDQLLAVVESDRRDKPYEFRDPTATDSAIARQFQSFIETEVERSPLFQESLRIQFGVGSLGNALMSALGQMELGDRNLIYYGEVIQDGLLDLIDEGMLTCASATSLALSTAGQARLFNQLERYMDDIILRPADLSNSPELINRFGVIAVNSALEVDLFGHVNSTHVNGSRVMNGIGGGGDFNRHAPLTVLTLPSTAADGDLSRIVPMVPHVDHTEHDIDVIITEHGVADLRGNSPRETATQLIKNCAHPEFQSDLTAYLDRGLQNGGHIPVDLDTAFDWHLDR